MATTTVSTVFASHRSPLEKTGRVGVLTFPGKHRASARRPLPSGSARRGCYPEKRICLAPSGFKGTGIISLQDWKSGFPLGFARNSIPCCTRPSPSTCSPELPLLSLLALKTRLCQVLVELQSAPASAPSAPENQAHTAQWALDHVQPLGCHQQGCGKQQLWPLTHEM